MQEHRQMMVGKTGSDHMQNCQDCIMSQLPDPQSFTTQVCLCVFDLCHRSRQTHSSDSLLVRHSTPARLHCFPFSQSFLVPLSDIVTD